VAGLFTLLSFLLVSARKILSSSKTSACQKNYINDVNRNRNGY